MKFIYTSIFAIIFSIAGRAQEYYKSTAVKQKEELSQQGGIMENNKSYLGFSYQMIAPLSEDFKNYVDKISDTGFALDLHFKVAKKMTLGATISYSYFSDKLPDEFILGSNGFYYSTQFRTAFNILLMPKFRYYPYDSKYITAYAGIGAGLNYNNWVTDISYYNISDKYTLFALQPEIGALIRVTSNIYINGNLNYNHSFPGSDKPNISFASWSIGLIVK